jgi:RNA polymerase sigma factor (sigma-70 family)
MRSSGKGPARPAELARDAGPVRLWLVRYFRRRIRNDADVEDMVQDVFVRIASRNSTEPVEHLAGYVMKTAASVLADRGRRQTTHMAAQHIAFDPEHHGDEEIDPERVFSGKEDLRAATAALLSLPERTRRIFILRRLEGLRHREIAQRIGVSVSAIEKHMVIAIRHLAAELEKRRGS